MDGQLIDSTTNLTNQEYFYLFHMLGLPSFFELTAVHCQVGDDVIIFDHSPKIISKTNLLQKVNEIVFICKISLLILLVDHLQDISCLLDLFNLMNENNIEELKICQKYISVIHISDELSEIRGSVQGQLISEQDYVFSFSELFLPCIS